jgi:hypothetical protein
VLNLGIRGVGPLNELAVLKEYGPFLRPRRILWVFYENDLDDLHLEKDNPRLLNYLGKPNRQSLLDRQPEVDAAVVSYLERRIGTVDEIEPRFALGGFLKLAPANRDLRAPAAHA